MEPEQYEILFAREDAHWWYAGMRRSAFALLATALSARPLRILDAGCGTGGTTARLRQFGDVTGIDVQARALELAAKRGLTGSLAAASVQALPFRDGTFDAAVSFEVLYHLWVGDDAQALRELRRVIRPGGVLLLRLPGHDWLHGRHDRLVQTRHRYTPGEVGAKLRRAGFQLEFVSSANSLLFLPAAAKRLLEMTPLARPASSDEPDLWQPGPAVNRFLEACVSLEAAAFVRRRSLPLGLSVIALARRPEG